MAKTPEQFVQTFDGIDRDFDGVYGTQCVDGFKCFLAWAGLPIIATGTGWAAGYWSGRYSLGLGQYFDFIEDQEDLQAGDWAVWDHGSSCTLSHISMFVKRESADRALFFGERQVTNDPAFHTVSLRTDVLGALRWKGWDQSQMKSITIQPGLTVSTIQGRKAYIRGFAEGHRLGLVSAAGDLPETALQPIDKIDTDQAIIYAAMNANYFQMGTDQADPYGTHYGTEMSFTNQFAPHNGQILAYAVMNDGSTFCALDNEYWYEPSEVQMACAPAYCGYYHGQRIDLWSPALKASKSAANTQSILIRTLDRFAFVVIADPISVAEVMAWAETVTDLQDLILMDSGGSTQLMNGFTKVLYTGRQISTALVEYVPKTSEIAPEPEDPGDDADTVIVEDPEPSSAINWAQKLSSRKLWATIVPMLVGILIRFGVAEDIANGIGSLILILVPPIVYMLVEGHVDASRESSRKFMELMIAIMNAITGEEEEDAEDD